MKLDGINVSQYVRGLSPLVLILALTVTPAAVAEEAEATAGTYTKKWEAISDAGKSLAGAVWGITKHAGKDVAVKGKKALTVTKDLLSRESTEDTSEDGTSI